MGEFPIMQKGFSPSKVPMTANFKVPFFGAFGLT